MNLHLLLLICRTEFWTKGKISWEVRSTMTRKPDFFFFFYFERLLPCSNVIHEIITKKNPENGILKGNGSWKSQPLPKSNLIQNSLQRSLQPDFSFSLVYEGITARSADNGRFWTKGKNSFFYMEYSSESQCAIEGIRHIGGRVKIVPCFSLVGYFNETYLINGINLETCASKLKVVSGIPGEPIFKISDR